MRSFVLPLLIAVPVLAQDRVVLVTGETFEDCKVQSFTIRELSYQPKGQPPTTVSSDRVGKVELGRFADKFRRAISERSSGIFVTTAEQALADKDAELAAFGYLAAANILVAAGSEVEAVAALDEMLKAAPESGLVPNYYRVKFEIYATRGKAGASNARIVAKKYADEAIAKAWPNGFQLEAEFFGALADALGGADPKSYQSKLRDIISRAQGAYPAVAGKANIQLADSLRATGDTAGAATIYEDVLSKEGADVNSRAAANLGIGLIRMGEGNAGNKDAYLKALLHFLRVRLEDDSAWASLQAEAMYNGMLAAEKWQGTDYRLIAYRCKQVLANEFKDTEWFKLASSR